MVTAYAKRPLPASPKYFPILLSKWIINKYKIIHEKIVFFEIVDFPYRKQHQLRCPIPSTHVARDGSGQTNFHGVAAH